jgi:hypothetical protein
LEQVERLIVVTHHPPLYGLNFPREPGPLSLDGLLWDGLAGNVGVELLLLEHASRIDMVFCGHTHRERAEVISGIKAWNVGSGYPEKRLLRIDWPDGPMRAVDFPVSE